LVSVGHLMYYGFITAHAFIGGHTEIQDGCHYHVSQYY
jgi:hypothetical protein